ncbi:MAG: nucleoside recognition domain-containing protein [Merdibacter sp.]
MHRERGRPVYTLLDRILLHPLLAYPLCILFFCWFLQMVFRGSTPWSDYIQMVAGDYLIPYLRYGMRSLPPAIVDFLTQGVVSGLAGVISFVPLMGTLYFWIAFLEESGYYARIAFLTDRIMSYFHLSGKAFLAMLLGCGCNVPGIIASRSLETQKQRMLTAVLVPFICSARLPVYLLFCEFLKERGDGRRFALWIGLFIAFLAAFLLSRLQLFLRMRSRS